MKRITRRQHLLSTGVIGIVSKLGGQRPQDTAVPQYFCIPLQFPHSFPSPTPLPRALPPPGAPAPRGPVHSFAAVPPFFNLSGPPLSRRSPAPVLRPSFGAWLHDTGQLLRCCLAGQFARQERPAAGCRTSICNVRMIMDPNIPVASPPTLGIRTRPDGLKLPPRTAFT
jgi:hypothetical protein